MFPIVVLWVLFMVLVAWLIITQLIVPARDRRIPFFPSFRPKAMQAARVRAALDLIEEAKREVDEAKALGEEVTGFGWQANNVVRLQLQTAEAKLREAYRAAEALGIHKEENGG